MVFESIPYLNYLSSYPRAFVIFFVLLILLRIGLYIVQRVFVKITSKTKSDLDDIFSSNKQVTKLMLKVYADVLNVNCVYIKSRLPMFRIFRNNF